MLFSLSLPFNLFFSLKVWAIVFMASAGTFQYNHWSQPQYPKHHTFKIKNPKSKNQKIKKSHSICSRCLCEGNLLWRQHQPSANGFGNFGPRLEVSTSPKFLNQTSNTHQYKLFQESRIWSFYRCCVRIAAATTCLIQIVHAISKFLVLAPLNW